ncbi:MAG: ATP-binding protein [Spirochaetales bacterium]|nr:ATP-binding protein [Spirochaetales bacterium]
MKTDINLLLIICLTVSCFIATIILARLMRTINKLKKYNRMLQISFNNSFQFIAILAPDGRIIEINSTARTLIRDDIKDYRGLQLWEASRFPDDHKLHTITKDAVKKAAGGKTSRKYVELHSKGGGPLFLDYTVKPVFNETGEIVQLIAEGRDITEKARLDEDIVKNEKMRSVGSLASGLAHEINNPLSGIIQSADLMKKRLTDPHLPANLKTAEVSGISMTGLISYVNSRGIPEILQAINDSGVRAAEIVKNMLDFTRTGDSDFSSCNPARLIDSSLELAKTDIELKIKYRFTSIELIKDYEENIPSILCVPDQFQQVMLNVLKNAAQAVHQLENPRIEIHLYSDSSWVNLEVRDNGSGMDKKVIARAFDPFYTTKEFGSATGLGLSVAYFIITQNLKGSITIASPPGSGAVIKIRLPLKDHPGESDYET